MEGAFGVLSAVWQFFTLDHPALGISYADILLGIFVVTVSISLLKPLLGIGGHVAHGFHIPRNRSKKEREKDA